MPQWNNTHVSRLKTRSPIHFADTPETSTSPEPQWREDECSAKDHFLRNLTVAAVLVLCAVTLRTGAIPALDHAADAVLTAATDHSLLDEQLGKLSFVSALFPEAVLVFAEQQPISAQLQISAEDITHAWSEAEPYTCWQATTPRVISATAGEVTGIYHGFEDELIVEVSDTSNLTWLYGNLNQIAVALGTPVQPGDLIGTVLTGEDYALEIRRNGESIDPQSLLGR